MQAERKTPWLNEMFPERATEDRAPVEAPPVIAPIGKPKDSGTAALLAVMAVVGASIFLALKLGFMLNGDRQPYPLSSDGFTAAAALVLAVGMGWGAWNLRTSRLPRARARKAAQAAAFEAAVAQSRRVAELASNPVTAKYAPLVERGEDWSDENIVYYEHPECVETCEHLQAIERAMRSAGIDCRRARPRSIRAVCRIDYPALQSSFEVAPPVRYAEYYAGDRDEKDFPMAFLICDAHTSMIHSLHPHEAGAMAAAVFPES